MGMTDRQFDTHQKRILRLLEKVKEEITTSGNSQSQTLDTMMKDIEEELKRP